jgi:hypothetical protein
MNRRRPFLHSQDLSFSTYGRFNLASNAGLLEGLSVIPDSATPVGPVSTGPSEVDAGGHIIVDAITKASANVAQERLSAIATTVLLSVSDAIADIYDTDV